ncbi:MAG: hypothetical protein KAS32_22635 [Candidatus Peribacteraceae bacterium]|nr:hypothetical protein [Candidatus Peribacteraceae bacterium]
MDYRDLLIECGWGDYKRHEINDDPDKFEYYVVSLFNKCPRHDSIHYREFPIVILHKGKRIYRDSTYFVESDWEKSITIAEKVVDLKNNQGLDVAQLAYSKDEVEFFSNKYFEVLL